jgi:Uma2 family endonuclease
MPDYLHGFICLEMGALLREFVKKHQLGRAMSNDSFVKVRKNPDSVFGADVCFISYERLPRGPIPSGLLDAVPELVVEVRSPSDAWTEIMVKVFDYLAAGVRAVVVFNSARPAVAVYRSEGDEEFFSLDQELVIPEILPGFRVAVRRFFEGSSP